MSTYVPAWLQRLDNRAIGFVRRNAVLLLRWALAIVFVWFGALKVFGVSPVADLVANTLPFLPRDVAVIGLGALEILIGLGLATGWALRVTMLVFFAQMIGTFVVLIVEPSLCFVHGDPLLLTTTGEFVIKNLVLVTAGLIVAGSIPPARTGETVAGMLAQRPD